MGRIKNTLIDQEAESDAYWRGFEAGMDASAGVDFPCPVPPVPCDPYEESPVLKGSALFTPEVIARVIDINKDWLQTSARTTRGVLMALFPCYESEGMALQNILTEVSVALFAAGYSPTGQSINTTWSFPA